MIPLGPKFLSEHNTKKIEIIRKQCRTLALDPWCQKVFPHGEAAEVNQW